MNPSCVSLRVLSGGWPELVHDHSRRQKLARMQQTSDRYVAFWVLISLVTFPLLGWSTLLVWPGLAWAMDRFTKAMHGSKRQTHRPKSHTTHSRRRRRCD